MVTAERKVKELTIYEPNGTPHWLRPDPVIESAEPGRLVFTMEDEEGKGRTRVTTNLPYWFERPAGETE